MLEEKEVLTLLKGFGEYMEDQKKYNTFIENKMNEMSSFVDKYIANADMEINMPKELKDDKGEAKNVKLPTDWVDKTEPLSGGDSGRKDYGSKGGNKSAQAKSGDPYLYKHDENGEDTEEEPVEKMPMSYAEDTKDEEEEDMGHEEDEDKDITHEEMKMVTKYIKSLAKQNINKQRQLSKQMALKSQLLLKKQEEDRINGIIQKAINEAIGKLVVKSEIPAPTEIKKSEVKEPIFSKSNTPVPGVPDKASFDNINMAEMLGQNVEDIGDFNKQVKSLSGKSTTNSLLGDFKNLNKMWDLAGQKNMGQPIQYETEFSKLQTLIQRSGLRRA